MRKIVLLLLLCLSGLSQARDYQGIADTIAKANGISIFSIHEDAKEKSIASIRPWSMAHGPLPQKVNHITYNKSMMDQLSEEAVAFIIAHEMAHGVLEHNHPKKTSIFRKQDELHKNEYDADELGLAMAIKAGYQVDANVILSIPRTFGMKEHRDSHSHPAWMARVAKARAPGSAEVVPKPLPKYSMIETNDGRVWIIDNQCDLGFFCIERK